VSPAQAEGVSRRLAANGFVDCRVRRDLAGRDRIVLATREKGSG
jgi:methylase of polypeptide subunit release factors